MTNCKICNKPVPDKTIYEGILKKNETGYSYVDESISDNNPVVINSLNLPWFFDKKPIIEEALAHMKCAVYFNVLKMHDLRFFGGDPKFYGVNPFK